MRKLVVGLLVALAISVAAQDRAQTPTFHPEANYVRVDVFPTVRGVPVGDLKQDDFEIIEDKVPQKVTAFEHVIVQANVAPDLRREPRTVAESREMAQTARGRVFVLFLDFYHVEGTASFKIQKPLVDALDRTLGYGDLIAVMTPDMTSRDLTFTAKTGSVEEILAQAWGHRDRVDLRDPEDENLESCYGLGSCPSTLATELVARRRETQTLDSLDDLVQYLRGVREERKAVLAVTDGWRLFEPNEALLSPPGIQCQGPTAALPPIGVDPRTGRLGGLPTSPGIGSNGPTYGSQCEADRQHLAHIDNQRRARDLGDEANRANVSFYPIDPRGLVASEQAMQPPGLPGVDLDTVPMSLRADIAMTAARQSSLRTLALDTDGTAIVATNDISGALRKVADDLSSYYLLGYYSTGKIDGKFHSISVKVKRSGVDVRARRGYLAPTAAAVAAASVAPPPPAPAAAVAEAAVITSALAPLGAFSRVDVPVLLQSAAGWTPDNAPAIWATGEFTGAEWKSGGQADVMLIGADRETRATAHVTLAPGTRSFRVRLDPANPVAAGDYSIMVRSRSADAGASPSSDTARLVVPASPETSGVLFVRRGPATGNKDLPTADPRFHRTEQIRVETLTTETEPAATRLLDRAGKPLALPVQSAIRSDADGSRWQTAQLQLAPLAVGDYLIELTRGAGTETKRTLIAFRIIP